MATPGVNLRMLESYLGGRWMAGTGGGTTLVNPATGEGVGWCSSSGADLRSALAYSRTVAGRRPSRAVLFHARGAPGQGCRLAYSRARPMDGHRVKVAERFIRRLCASTDAGCGRCPDRH